MLPLFVRHSRSGPSILLTIAYAKSAAAERGRCGRIRRCRSRSTAREGRAYVRNQRGDDVRSELRGRRRVHRDEPRSSRTRRALGLDDVDASRPPNISNAAANAVRVSVRRDAVTELLHADSLGLAREPSAVRLPRPRSRAERARSRARRRSRSRRACCRTTPRAISSARPTSASRTAPQSVGLTHPDGSSPVNGNNTMPYFKAAVRESADVRLAVRWRAPTSLCRTATTSARRPSTTSTPRPTTARTRSRSIIPVVDKTCGAAARPTIRARRSSAS